MTTFTNGFDEGTNGTTLTQGAGGNTGDTYDNFFDTITIGTGATLAFDNTHAAHGVLSCKVASAGTAATAFTQWDTSFGTGISQVWFRQYLYFTANPGSAYDVFEAASAGGLCAGVQLATNGTLIFRNSAGTTIFTTTAAIPLNQWFRIEGFVIGSATVGQVSLSLYDSPDSAVATETDTSAATQNTRGTMSQWRFGLLTSRANAGPFWQDDVGLSTAGPLGPLTGPVFRQASRPAQAPVARPPRGRSYVTQAAAVQAAPPPVTSGPVFFPFCWPARARIQPPPRGRAASSPGGPVANPSRGPAFRQAVQATRARLPVPFLKGRAAGNPGGPVVNPTPGPVFYPAVQAVRARLPVPFLKGRVSGNPGAPVANPSRGPVFRQAAAPAQARLPRPPRGRAVGNPGGPVQNPSPVITGPPLTPLRWPARIRPQLPPRGRVTSSAGAPVRNPAAGPVFRQAVQPCRARVQPPPRGRMASNPGGPARNPAVNRIEVILGQPYTRWKAGQPYTR